MFRRLTVSSTALFASAAAVTSTPSSSLFRGFATTGEKESSSQSPSPSSSSSSGSSTVSTRVDADKADVLMKMRVKADTYKELKPEHTKNFKDMRPLPTEAESDEDLRRRLIFQSRYRGMVEMDVIFGLFAKTRLPIMDRQGLVEYDQLLRQLDNDLFNWLVMGHQAPAEVSEIPLFKELRQFMIDHKDDIVAERL